MFIWPFVTVLTVPVYVSDGGREVSD